MLSETEYLLICLTEECAEVQQLCAKAQRFGLDSYHPDDSLKRQNIDKLKLEINDILGVISKLEALGLWDGKVTDDELITRKINKLDKMMNFSKSIGTLQ